MKTVLITGANKGIGFETAKQLGKKGFHVIISGRNEKKLEAAVQLLRKNKGSYDQLLMDVSDKKSVAAAAIHFGKKHQQLDVLINNAGILLKNDQSIIGQKEEILEETLSTNSFGPLRTIKSFLPYMQKGSRIINISSGGGSMSDPVGGWSPAYCVSKTLLNAITRQTAYELSSQNISVNAVCPGWTKTDMGGSGATRTASKGAETPVWLASDADPGFTGKFFRDKKEIEW